jgi:hypothetical protein
MYVCMYGGGSKDPALAPRPSMIYCVFKDEIDGFLGEKASEKNIWAHDRSNERRAQ